jgi:hypothetical protein
MSLDRDFLLSAESFLESFKPIKLDWGLSITAADTTGPAKGPLPASSTPAIINLLNRTLL